MNFTNILILLSALSTSVIGADMGDGLVMTAPAVGTADALSDGGHGCPHTVQEVCPQEFLAIDSCLLGSGLDDAGLSMLYTGLFQCFDDHALGAPLPELLSMDNVILCQIVCGVTNTCIDDVKNSTAAMGIDADSCNPLYYEGANCFVSKASDQLADCVCAPSSFGLVASILNKNLRA